MEGLHGIVHLSGKPYFGQGMSGNFMLKILNEPCVILFFVCPPRLRFVYEDLSSTKIDNRVVFPHTDLDVMRFLAGPSSSFNIYDLYSIVCHYGGEFGSFNFIFPKFPQFSTISTALSATMAVSLAHSTSFSPNLSSPQRSLQHCLPLWW